MVRDDDDDEDDDDGDGDGDSDVDDDLRRRQSYLWRFIDVSCPLSID